MNTDVIEKIESSDLSDDLVKEYSNAMTSSLKYSENMQKSNDTCADNVATFYKEASNAYGSISNDTNNSIDDRMTAAEKQIEIAEKYENYARDYIKTNNEKSLSIVKYCIYGVVALGSVIYGATKFIVKTNSEELIEEDLEDDYDTI